jgi:hypothetical protein
MCVPELHAVKAYEWMKVKLDAFWTLLLDGELLVLHPGEEINGHGRPKCDRY